VGQRLPAGLGEFVDPDFPGHMHRNRAKGRELEVMSTQSVGDVVKPNDGSAMPSVVATACYSTAATEGSSSASGTEKSDAAKDIPKSLVITFSGTIRARNLPSIFVLGDHLHLTQPHSNSASKRVLKHPRRLDARSHSLMLTPVQ
jgi:hypothetical protein